MYRFVLKSVRVSFSLCALMLAVSGQAQAGFTVVTFDDLPGNSALVPDGYGGINWGSQWVYYGDVQPPYNPHSGANRVYSTSATAMFTFVTPGQVFDGAWFAGTDTTTVEFEMFSQGNLVATSSVLTTSATPTFLSSGYTGSVDSVEVFSNAPDFYVMDDVTYGTAAIPEPSSIVMCSSALVIAGMGLRCRRRSSERTVA